MEREKVIQLMRTVCIPVGKAECTWWDMADGVPTQISRLIELVEQETLERAAMVCETNARELVFDDHAQGCRDCASDIRNLKDNHDKE